jgi:hypothetical protein
MRVKREVNVIVCGLGAVRGLSPRLASYWGALRAARPHRLNPPASMSPQQVAAFFFFLGVFTL